MFLKDNFEAHITLGEDRVNFRFELVYYGGTPIYHVTYVNEFEKHETFLMEQDENGQWKIRAQVLPKKIFDIELDLNDAIESAQDSN